MTIEHDERRQIPNGNVGLAKRAVVSRLASVRIARKGRTEPFEQIQHVRRPDLLDVGGRDGFYWRRADGFGGGQVRTCHDYRLHFSRLVGVLGEHDWADDSSDENRGDNTTKGFSNPSLSVYKHKNTGLIVLVGSTSTNELPGGSRKHFLQESVFDDSRLPRMVFTASVCPIRQQESINTSH